jgi:hypothetical protein
VERFCKSQRDRDDLIFLYLTGHGIKDDEGNLYFAMRDTDRDLLRTTALGADLLNAVMNDSPARSQVLMLDCCYSGAFARALRPKGSGDVDLAGAFTGGRGRVVLAASGAVEQAWEGDGGSIYTRAVVEGITSGTADLDGDGRITASELHTHVVERLRSEGGQTPRKFEFDEAGGLVLARVGQTASMHTPSATTAPVTPTTRREPASARRPRGRRWVLGAGALVVGLGALWATGFLDSGSPTALAGLTPTLSETYDDNSRGWAEGDHTDEAATYTFTFDGGSYLVDFTTFAEDQTYWSIIDFGPVDQPYAVEVSTETRRAAARCGLALGDSDALTVVTLGDAEVVAQAVSGDTTVPLGRWPVSVAPGDSADMSLRIDDDTATVYVDGVEVGSFPAGRLGRATRLGVAAWGQDEASCEFEEITVHE